MGEVVLLIMALVDIWWVRVHDTTSIARDQRSREGKGVNRASDKLELGGRMLAAAKEDGSVGCKQV